ncbi:hypothetical protein [Halalkalibacterium ligniniphilum]|uniref:hypothetical protein n=1 Tax=Halalkalibacterium ligniniphilum TaxID=1134413 RepID=UPI00036A6194|nr:hypothetical protein [Halalkalibacterium ligniniphilum]
MGKGGNLGDSILWVNCVSCSGSFYCELDLLHMDVHLICPFCETEFLAKAGAQKESTAN